MKKPTLLGKPVKPDDGFRTPIINQNEDGDDQTGTDTYEGGSCVLRWCVSARVTKDGASVKDTKDKGGPILTFDRGEWDAFITAVKAGQYDLPS